MSIRPGQEQYTSDPSTSRPGGAPPSRPPTSHGIPPPPPLAGTSNVPGFAYRGEPPHNNGASSFYSQPGDNNNSISRPSSTPIGPVHSSWAAPGLANASMNSLGLSEPTRDAGGNNNNNSQRARPMSASANNSVSSWGTADTTSAQGDLFSTLHPLSSAPADSGFPTSDLLPRPDGQLLGVVRAHHSRRPSFPVYVRALNFFFCSGPPCADCDTTTTAAATVHDAADQSRCLGARRGQPLVLSPSTEPAFPIAGVAEFLSCRPRISLCFRATSVLSDPLCRPTIRHSRYPTLVSLRPSAFDFVSTIIPSRIGSSPN